MTREEAIAIIENEKECVNRANKNDYCNRDCYNCELVKTDTEILTALDMAIQALSQEPCTDAVSRQAAIDAFERFIHELGIEDEPYNYGEMALSAKNVPPVTQKSGKWIERIERDEYDDYEEIWYECDQCHADADCAFNYCPNCGAKMESEVNNG